MYPGCIPAVSPWWGSIPSTAEQSVLHQSLCGLPGIRELQGDVHRLLETWRCLVFFLWWVHGGFIWILWDFDGMFMVIFGLILDFDGMVMVIFWDVMGFWWDVYGDCLGCYGILMGDSKMAIRKEPPKMLENHGKPPILLVLMGISLG